MGEKHNTAIGIDEKAQRIVLVLPDNLLSLTAEQAEQLATTLFQLAQSLKEMQEQEGQ